MSQEGPMEAMCKVCGKFSKNKRGLVQHMQVIMITMIRMIILKITIFVIIMMITLLRI